MKIRIDPLIFTPVVTRLLRWWSKTIRFEVHGDWKRVIEGNAAGDSFVVALWHGELFPVINFGVDWANQFVIVVSQSKDGEFIAQVLEKLGTKTVRGSSSRGGLKALLQSARIMKKENRIAVFTIDGPRGPRHKAKDGAIFMAQRAGAKVVPIRMFPRTRKVFDSWDKFVLPMPFTKCRAYIGEPMKVTEEKLEKDVLARERERLEKRMQVLGSE
ncbi:lysophospholipid acyltransferase family protein [Pseudodesulfovibrio sp. zrk46]|uniref:lysophospholipid acyltransferase family protein n=1 Tax=Pseudodesulfovibrio sp. zrk46 TaxID=2725288 RepID=UPI0014492F0A|nr:lysophospholipid acyltransferase family protein [Pseudodesulfovibrio sp. zrk46]QJB57736.1 lysophospholipid acyltransferase family protein [Pseudodesulfovibrio sp. zrk46]